MTTYFLYARKSQERDDRQVASIEDQITEMSILAKKKDFVIKEIFEESMSAKRPGRPVFNQMMKRIKSGEVHGILCWKLNRLARNPLDGGVVADLLIEGVLSEIQTSQKGYYPQDNIISLMVEFGMATQYSKDLSVDVKRGLRRKALERKWFPLAVLPVGYKHNPMRIEDPSKDEIINDSERFTKLQELWNLLKTGAYSITEIYQKAQHIALVNTKGKPYSYSSFHRIFQNPFYAGYFFWKDEEGNKVKVQGKHEPMVSVADFERIQLLFKKNARNTRVKTYTFSYKEMFRCGSCSGSITADRKYRAICTECKRKFSIKHTDKCPSCKTRLDEMDNPSILDITYYQCTRAKRKQCHEKNIQESVLEQELLRELKAIEIHQDFYQYAKRKLNTDEIDSEHGKHILVSMKRKEQQLSKKKQGLVSMRALEEISKEDYLESMKLISEELDVISREIILKENQFEYEKQDANKYLDFAVNCVERFKTASKDVKKEMIQCFCSNPQIMGKHIVFQRKKPLSAVISSQKIQA